MKPEHGSTLTKVGRNGMTSEPALEKPTAPLPLSSARLGLLSAPVQDSVSRRGEGRTVRGITEPKQKAGQTTRFRQTCPPPAAVMSDKPVLPDRSHPRHPQRFPTKTAGASAALREPRPSSCCPDRVQPCPSWFGSPLELTPCAASPRPSGRRLPLLFGLAARHVGLV